MATDSDVTVGKQINAALKRAIANSNPPAVEPAPLLTNSQVLSMFGKLMVAILSTSCEDGASLGETEGARLLRALSPQLTSYEYRLVQEGWSEYRLYANEEKLKEATEYLTHRIRSA